MSYLVWLWRFTRGFRLNIAARVVMGALRVSLGLLMVWLSKRFIDETIRTGSDDDIVRMVVLLVLTVVGSVVLRQICFYMTADASVRAASGLRLKMFEVLFRRKLYDVKELADIPLQDVCIGDGRRMRNILLLYRLGVD